MLHNLHVLFYLILTTALWGQFSSVQSLSHVRLFASPWIAAHRASLSITNSRSLPKLMPIESVMPSSHLILCCPLLLLPPISPIIRVFSNESTLCMRWPEYWNFSLSISPSKEHPGLISFRKDCEVGSIISLSQIEKLKSDWSNVTPQGLRSRKRDPNVWDLRCLLAPGNNAWMAEGFHLLVVCVSRVTCGRWNCQTVGV